MQREQLELLKTLQALEFTALDLSLYLNTHPGDQRALTDYSNVMCEVNRVRQLYTMNYGPLTAEDSVNQPVWRWAQDPWPWDLDYRE